MSARFPSRPRRNTSPLEKDEQLGIRKLMLQLGGTEYVLGTRRSRGKPCPTCKTFVPEHQGTLQTPGIADLQFFLPERRTEFVLYRSRRFVVVEAKREQGGRFSSEQIGYRDLCIAAGIDYIGGCLQDVIVWLVDEGYMDPKNLPHYRQGNYILDSR